MIFIVDSAHNQANDHNQNEKHHGNDELGPWGNGVRQSSVGWVDCWAEHETKILFSKRKSLKASSQGIYSWIKGTFLSSMQQFSFSSCKEGINTIIWYKILSLAI